MYTTVEYSKKCTTNSIVAILNRLQVELPIQSCYNIYYRISKTFKIAPIQYTPRYTPSKRDIMYLIFHNSFIVKEG